MSNDSNQQFNGPFSTSSVYSPKYGNIKVEQPIGDFFNEFAELITSEVKTQSNELDKLAGFNQIA